MERLITIMLQNLFFSFRIQFVRCLLKFIIILSLSSVVLHGQKYSFNQLSTKDGLPNSAIVSMYQDSRGVIWISTQQGEVCMYDGYSFHELIPDETKVGLNINSFAEDKSGRIWMGGDEGLFMFNGNSLRSYSKSISNELINKVYIDFQGNLWILSQQGVTFLNIEEPNFKVDEVEKRYLIRSKNFVDIAEDEYGRFWLVADSSIIILTPNEFKYVEIGINQILPKVQYTNIETSDENGMWLGTSDKGVFLLSYDSISCFLKRSYNSYFDNIDDNIVTLKIDKNDNLWIGTDNNGLVYIDYPFVRSISSKNGLASDFISVIVEDKEGIIWIGTKDKGINTFSGWHLLHYDRQTGLIENTIKAISQDNSGYYWYAGNDGLYRFSEYNNHLRVFNVFLPKKYKDATINDIVFQGTDEVFFGTKEFGVIRVINDEVVTYNKLSGLPSNMITSLWLEDDNQIWVGTNKGLVKIVNDSVIDLSKEHLLKYEVNCITGKKDGTIWVGTLNGVYGVLADSIFSLNIEHSIGNKRVTSLYLDKNSNLFIGTLGGGLLYVGNEEKVPKILKAQNFVDIPSLNSKNILSVAGLNDSTLLIGTDKGANKVIYLEGPTVKEVISYNSLNGFSNLECIQNSILVDKNKNVWFGTNSGLTRYNAQFENSTTLSPNIYFTGFEVNFESVSWQKSDSQESQWFNFPENLVLKHNQNYLNFKFSSVFYSDELFYETFLEGHDKSWNEPNVQRFIRYSNLSPGNYSFKVRSITKSGIIGEEKSINFKIKPPFYKTWWFTLIIVQILVSGIVIYIRLREKKLVRAKKQLENTVALRTREIQEQKSFIEFQNKSLTDSIEYAKKIQEAAISKTELLKNYVNDYFLIFLPRDIVSGDFYWFGEYENRLVFSVVDCTGHGVPGAFMSMLGIRLLNEIVIEKGITDPAEILNRLRAGVVYSLQQKGEEVQPRDGMDMAICSYDLKRRKLVYSGAYNPLWLVRNNELIQFKADRMPVGYHDKIAKFRNNEIDCQKEDRIYIFSDGLQDQFGGPEQKKYKPKRLREIILANSNLRMEEQKNLLLKDYNKWIDGFEQVDDITFLGLKF